MSRFARTPEPPYYAVIFSAQRTAGDNGYAETAARRVELVAQQPGFLGVESTRDADGFGITVAYFRERGGHPGLETPRRARRRARAGP